LIILLHSDDALRPREEEKLVQATGPACAELAWNTGLIPGLPSAHPEHSHCYKWLRFITTMAEIIGKVFLLSISILC
jgi:hypothetical protein